MEIKQILHGGSTGSIIAKEFHRHLLRSAPEKKRKEKDSRLSTDNKRVLTDETYILGKQEQLLNSEKKAANKCLKNRKRNLPVLDKAVDIILPVLNKAPDIVPVQINVFARIASVIRNAGKDNAVVGVNEMKVLDKVTQARKLRVKKTEISDSNSAVTTPHPVPTKARKTRAKKQ